MKLALVRSTELFGLLEQHGPRLVLQRFQVSIVSIVSIVSVVSCYVLYIFHIICICRLCVCVCEAACKYVYKHLCMVFVGVCWIYLRVVHPCLQFSSVQFTLAFNAKHQHGASPSKLIDTVWPSPV